MPDVPDCNLFRRALLLAALGAVLTPAAGASPQRELLIYVGTTMVPPIAELGRIFERAEGVKVSIAQGTSDNLYRSAKKSQVGDLYLPGEPGYLERYKADGLLGEQVTVGYNRLAIVVRKGNPKAVGPELNALLRDDLRVMIGGPDGSSVGAEAKSVLEVAGIYSRVVERAAFLAPDSRGLSTALRNGEADAILTWRAIALFPDNAPVFDLIDLDAQIARPRALRLTLLTLSKNPGLARRFMAMAGSDLGQAVFRRYGFIEAPSAPGM
jgi:molybdate transport system substrate-binding protein